MLSRFLAFSLSLGLTIAFTAADDSGAVSKKKPAESQILELNQQQLEQRPILGKVLLQGDHECALQFPDTFLGNPIHGRVLLENNSDQSAKIDAIVSSCGCTSAVPVQRTVASEKSDWLLLDYTPKAIGRKPIGVRFDFGGTTSDLKGEVRTRPRFVVSKSAVRFPESRIAEIILRKTTGDPVDRLIIHPADAFTSRFRDEKDKLVVQVRCLEERYPSRIILTPILRDQTQEDIPLDAFYVGRVEVFPKRCVAVEDTVRLFLRGDVMPLESVNEIAFQNASDLDASPQIIECQPKLRGNILTIEFQNPFSPGEHRLRGSLGTVSFPVLLTVPSDEKE